ncbi:MAG: phosphoribosylglycinamide formyltransferase [Rhodospirillales bacterium]|nr:MAG: phosphoribosylglycinamide formyltransferase [Rhodospirillales bacterium]
MAKLKLGVLISGRGSNLKALIDACKGDDFPAEIVLVIANLPGAGGLGYAEEAGIPVQVIHHRDFPDRERFEDELHQSLKRAGVELVCLAGFMRLLTENFVNRWWDRLINIHPSLLPAFRGLHTHERVLEYGARFTGCTVHFVRPAMDDGPIIAQAVVPVALDDDAESLAERVLREEHTIYALAVRMIAESRVRVVQDRVVAQGASAPRGALISPILHRHGPRGSRNPHDAKAR